MQNLQGKTEKLVKILTFLLLTIRDELNVLNKLVFNSERFSLSSDGYLKWEFYRSNFKDVNHFITKLQIKLYVDFKY